MYTQEMLIADAIAGYTQALKKAPVDPYKVELHRGDRIAKHRHPQSSGVGPIFIGPNPYGVKGGTDSKVVDARKVVKGGQHTSKWYIAFIAVVEQRIAVEDFTEDQP